MNEVDLAQQFPHLDQDEQRTLLRFCEAMGQTQRKGIAAEREMILLIHRVYNTLSSLPLQSELRPFFRAKLLNIAGIYALIPVSKVLRRIKPRRYTPRSTPISPPQREVEFYVKEWEITPKQIRKIGKLGDLFYGIGEKGWDYLSWILDDVDLLILKPNIEDDLHTPLPISSTSEPLTRTILVNTSDDGEPRDEVSIAFDIVYQAQFCRIFHQAPKEYGFPYCEHEARYAAGEFVDRVFDYYQEIGSSKEFLHYLEGLIQTNLKRMEEIS